MFAEVKSNPLVSIACITFNHESYIRQCLDGFIMQKTNFAYEIVIHDDASTDKTQEIILEYCSKHPKLFRPIFQKDNKYKEGKGILARFVFPECRGKYIALCEGDDYWTDPLKLQKQVEFLENNSGFVMCSHRNSRYYQHESRHEHNPKGENQVYTLDMLLNGEWLFNTLTVLFKREALDVEKLIKTKNNKDLTLFYYILSKGNGYYLNDEMAVYRIHNDGVWSGVNDEEKLLWEYKSRLSIYEVEKSQDAAKLILNLLMSHVGRKFWFMHCILISKVLVIIKKHFGCSVAIKMIIHKLILGKITF